MPRRIAFWVPLFCILSGWPAQSAHAEPASFPTFGLTFDSPADAAFKLTDGQGQIAYYVFGKSSKYSGAAIKVEVMPNRNENFEALVASVSKSKRAGIVKDQLTIGGEKAVRVSETDPANGGHAVAYMTIHGDWLYAFQAMMEPKVDAAKPIDDLVATVKFIPIEAPAGHLTKLADEPFNVLGLFTIAGPRCMRINSIDQGHVHLQVYNLDAHTPEMIVNVMIIPLPAPKTFAEIRDVYSKGLHDGLHLAETLQWHAQAGVPGLNVSQPVRTEVSDPDGNKTAVLNRFCVLEAGNGKFAQILFTVAAKAPEDSQKYVELSDRMLATVKVRASGSAAKP